MSCHINTDPKYTPENMDESIFFKNQNKIIILKNYQ